MRNAPAMGIVRSYLNAAGQCTQFTGGVPVGDYELYLGCDFVKNGYLDYLFGGVNGVYDRIIVHVR